MLKFSCCATTMLLKKEDKKYRQNLKNATNNSYFVDVVTNGYCGWNHIFFSY